MDGFHYAQAALTLPSISGRKSHKAYKVYTGGVFALFCFSPLVIPHFIFLFFLLLHIFISHTSFF